jgi:two-component system phosphate regulon sensor histidine kinase PhoR
MRWRTQAERWLNLPFSGSMTLVGGMIVVTALIWSLDYVLAWLVNPGVIYLPLVAMLAYHWGLRQAIIATLLQLCCVYVFFLSPALLLKPLTAQGVAELLTLAGVTIFVLVLVQLARERRAAAEREAQRSSALNRVGTALASELDEARLLQLIAQIARDLSCAEFAAFTLRPLNDLGQPIGPSEGSLFHLASVVGVTKAQEQLLRRMPLGGEGLLAPIFRQGRPVRVADATAFLDDIVLMHHSASAATVARTKATTEQGAFAYAHGPEGQLRARGVPRGHPMIRSFLGAPLLNHSRQVIGGLLLGHSQPGQFTAEDETLLLGLSAQATIALENARLYRATQVHAQELDAIFEHINDGVVLLDAQRQLLRENGTARRLKEQLMATEHGKQELERLLYAPARCALTNQEEQSFSVSIVDGSHEQRDFLINASPLRLQFMSSLPFQQGERGGLVVVVTWHDVTETRRLLLERSSHAETEARRALLQGILDALPSSVYLVHGYEARLVLANHAATILWGASWQPDQPWREFLAQNQIRLARIDNRPLPLSESATLRAVQRGETVSHAQELIRHADGTTLPVLVNAVALRMDHLNVSSLATPQQVTGEPEQAALVVYQDVSALKEAEQLKDEFIGIAAHELRTPIAVLKGYAQMLLIQTARGKGPALLDWQIEALHSIDQGTLRLVELIEDLLDVTRLQAGRLELHVEPVDLVALTRRVVARLQMTTEQHRLSLDTAVDTLVVAADPKRLEQILGNLISNAIKYSPEGDSVALQISRTCGPDTALLCVRDHGIGIPEDQQAHIFERFVRARNTETYGIGGTGLGLYLCRELVERLGGQIWFASNEGEGSTFFIALPVYQEQG